MQVLQLAYGGLMKCSEIPVAHTPAGGYGPTFPPLILGDCTEPLVEGAPDLRGIWKVITATRAGETIAPDDRLMSYTERVEQCGNRIVDCGGGTIADARATAPKRTECTTSRSLITRHRFISSRHTKTASLCCDPLVCQELKSRANSMKAVT